MDTVIALIVEVIAGGVGGLAIGRLAAGTDMGAAVNAIVGVIGGVAGVWIAGMIPGLDAFVGMAAPVATDTTETMAASGTNVGALVGQGVTGLVGGGVLTAIAGMVKNTMMKS